MADHEAYRQFHEVIAKRQLSNNEAFDKAILSLSSGGLGLSLTFFKLAAPVEQAVAISALKCSWYLFLTAVISIILSYTISQRALATELSIAEKYYLEGDEMLEAKTTAAAMMTEIAYRLYSSSEPLSASYILSPKTYKVQLWQTRKKLLVVNPRAFVTALQLLP